ncbi:hypothetical protein [Sediminitomix flava]|uniref:Uncharacterized protein n=1 Tax=Sediminitomix flava TaxID=379075 RepID=A0A315ZNN3_SEDFL|nr:hypothetical protein [Sediminitomix flava]PWJ36119.1 hypothetical protein BC781_109135 [Sediminitomix flava]
MKTLSLKRVENKIKLKEQQKGAIGFGLLLCMGLNGMMFVYFLQRIELNKPLEGLTFTSLDYWMYFGVNLLLLMLTSSVFWAKWAARRNKVSLLKYALVLTICLFTFLYPFAEHLLRFSVSGKGLADAQIMLMETFFFLQLGIGFIGCLVLLVKSFQFKIHSKKKYLVNVFSVYMSYHTFLWTWITLDVIFF